MNASSIVKNQTQRKPDGCEWCQKALDLWAFCPYCGRVTGRISDPILSKTRLSLQRKQLEIADGGTFVVRFEHVSGGVVNIDCSIAFASNISFAGRETSCKSMSAQSSKNIGGYFEFSVMDSHNQPSGYILFTLDNEERDLRKIWKKKNKKEIKFSLSGRVFVASERWICGSSCVLYPPGVTSQNIFIYNGSSVDRKFNFDPPPGYAFESDEAASDMNCVNISGHTPACIKAIELKNSDFQQGETVKWRPGAGTGAEIGFFKMISKKEKPADDLIIAIDFGTSNIGIRVRWPKGNPIFNRKRGTIESIGEDRFPCAMVLDKTGREFFWGADAVKRIERTTAPNGFLTDSPNLIPVTNLKTDLRMNEEKYTKYRPEWTNENLTVKIFSQIIKMIRDWTKKLFTEKKMSQPVGFRLNDFFSRPKFVLTIPVLDSGKEYDRYGQLLKSALIKASSDGDRIDEEQISLISEPQAAINFCSMRKSNELASLPNGSIIAVIDSGGGTTDVVIAKTNKTEGMLKLDVIASDHIVLNERLKQHYKISDIEFGGYTIDLILADIFGREAKKLLLSAKPMKYDSLWEAVWGYDWKLRTDEKVRYSRRIKERFSDDEMVNLRIVMGGEAELLTADYDRYAKHVVGPVMNLLLRDLHAGLLEKGTDLRQISALFLIGGTNLCRKMRACYTSQNFFNLEYQRADDSLSNYDRFNAVVNGAVLGKSAFFKPAVLTLRIKDRDGFIDDILIREHDVFTPVTLLRSIEITENNSAILDLIAESELFDGPIKIASAVCWRDMSSGDECADEDGEFAVFEVTLTKEACKCKIFSGEKSMEGWNVKLA